MTEFNTSYYGLSWYLDEEDEITFTVASHKRGLHLTRQDLVDMVYAIDSNYKMNNPLTGEKVMCSECGNKYFYLPNGEVDVNSDSCICPECPFKEENKDD